MVCTFFGHSKAGEEIVPLLRSTLTDLIEAKDVVAFLVGNNGNFDAIVRGLLKDLSNIFPHIKYFVVLAYRPVEKVKNPAFDFSDTIYPDVLANTPQRYAIDRRNRWMIDKSDYVITHAKYPGGAAKFKALAEKKGKIVINIM